MITKLSVQNFKSLKDISIETTNLNVLTGLNGMGKSSLIQILLLLKQSFSTIIESGNIFLNNELVELGKCKDILYQFAEEEKLYFHLLFADSEDKLIIESKYSPELEYLESKVLTKNSRDKLSNYPLFKSLKYLYSDRLSPQSVYNTSYGHVNNYKEIGKYGEFTPHYLNTYGNRKIMNKNLIHPKGKSEILLHQVEAWLSEISPGVKLNTTEIPGTENILLDFQFETMTGFTSRFRPKNVGFGLSFVLPVLTLILGSDKDSLIIIENPESHIHPRGQVELGKLIALAAESGAQLFIETHSDHIINGVRVAVKEGLIQKEKASILYFEKVNEEMEQYSKITSIKIDKNGELSDYPKDFLDEWSNQLLKLV